MRLKRTPVGFRIGETRKVPVGFGFLVRQTPGSMVPESSAGNRGSEERRRQKSNGRQKKIARRAQAEQVLARKMGAAGQKGSRVQDAQKPREALQSWGEKV